MANDRMSEFEYKVMPELPMLYRIAMRLKGSEADAEDLVAAVLYKAAKAWAQFDGRHLRSWLVRMMKNEHTDEIRRRNSRPQTTSLDALDGCPIHEGSLDVDSLTLNEIVSAIDRLPEEFRMTIVLYDVEQLSYEEVAEAMAIPVGTVRSRLFRARRLLRRALPHHA